MRKEPRDPFGDKREPENLIDRWTAVRVFRKESLNQVLKVLGVQLRVDWLIFPIKDMHD